MAFRLPLRRWKAVLGPSEWATVVVEQRVLLLDAEPRLLGCALLRDIVTGLAVVGLQRRSVVHVSLTPATERTLSPVT